VIFTVVSVTLEFILGLVIALGINRAFRAGGWSALPSGAVGVPDGHLGGYVAPDVPDRIGIIQYVANAIGIISEPILSDRTLLLIAAILVDVWKTTPFMALLLLAGLQTIPGEVYEAARVDGANVWQRFFQITLPLLKAPSWSRPLPYPRLLPGL
jgi:multiple sugar transport system permease protein